MKKNKSFLNLFFLLFTLLLFLIFSCEILNKQNDPFGTSVTTSSTINVYFQQFYGSTLPSGWTTGAPGKWVISNDFYYSSSYSIRSTNYNNYSTNFVTNTLSLSFCSTYKVSFYLKISSEANYDKLKFYVNSISFYYANWSGSIDWTYYYTNLYLCNGDKLIWGYGKDVSGSSGYDAAWIDDVRIDRL